MSALAIRSVSRACRGPTIVVGVSASAARMRALLVMDLEPGSRTVALTAVVAAGAAQLAGSVVLGSLACLQRLLAAQGV